MKSVIPKHKRVQYFSAFAASLGGFCTGTVLAWSSAVNYLEPPTNLHEGFQIPKEDLPLAAAILNLGALVFALPSAKLADCVGRTPAILFAMLLFLISWVMLAFTTQHIAIILIARFLAGIAMGGVCVVSNMYIQEISTTNQNRALLSSGFSILLALGLVFVNCLVLFTRWQEYHLFPALFPVLFALCFLVIPESPVYLVSKGKIEHARMSLKLLRKEVEVEEELNRLQKSHSKALGAVGIKELFIRKSNIHALVGGLGVSMYQQLSNINGLIFYSISIFAMSASTETSVSAPVAAIIVNVFFTCAVASSILLLQKATPKMFLILSATIMAICHFGLAVYFNVKQNGVQFYFMGYVPLVLIIGFMVGYSVGFGPISSQLTTDMFSPSIKGYAAGIIVVVNWLMCFLVTYFFPMMMEKLGMYETFYVFGGVTASAIIFLKFVVPETEGRSLVMDAVN